MELCAGMGGMGIALQALGYDVVGAFDSWDEAVAVYNHNLGGARAEVCNLLTARGRARVAHAKQKVGDLELLAAGPPCKGYSQLRNGRHDGRNGHNRVLAAMPDYVALLRPHIFVFENVPDVLRHRGGRTIASLIQRLERPARGLRYHVEYQTFDAAWFGTPQARRRTLVLGVRGRSDRGVCLPPPGPDLTLLYAALRHGGPVPAHLLTHLEALRNPDDRTLTTARQALSDLPLLAPGAVKDSRAYKCEPRSAFQRWVRRGAPRAVRDMQTPRVTPAAELRLSYIPPGGCARSIPREHLNGLSRRYDSAYRRLHPDAPSTALSTKYDCVYHYARTRSLSVREYARLQAIPDRVSFPAALACRRSAYEMIGNSVPPPLLEGVLSHVLDVLGEDGG